jgi:photosystem II stability/assembly factor-like uncharacterized protein
VEFQRDSMTRNGWSAKESNTMNETKQPKSANNRAAGIWFSLLLTLFLTLPANSHAQSKSLVPGESRTAGAWRSVGPAPPAIEASIAVDAATRTVYIASLGGGILKSRDGGQTFAPANQGLGSLIVASLAMAQNDPNLVYAGTGAGIYKTTDGGATWSATGSDLLPLSLIIDPTDPNILYAGFNGDLQKTTDGGDTWLSSANGIDNPLVFSLAIDPNNTSVVYAGTAGTGAFKSVDGGATWNPLNVDTTVWSLYVDPSNSNVIYAGSNGNGVYKSTNAGASFARTGSPAVGVVLALAKNGKRLYAGTATQGVSVSKDDGATWTNTGISEGLGLVLSAASDGSVYAGTNFDGVFERIPSTKDSDEDDRRASTWRRLAWAQLKNCRCQNGHALGIDPNNHEHVFFSTNDGGLFVTREGGRDWEDGGEDGLTSRAPRSIAFDPQDSNLVYAGSFTGGGLYRSHDHGRHWERRLFGSSKIYVAGVTVDPVDHSIYVSTFRSGDGIWKSADFGETFIRIDRAPGSLPDDFLFLSGRGITVNPQHHRTVFFAGNSGIWRSTDAGASWINVDESPSLSVTVDPVESNIVYAGTFAGVLKSVDGGASFVSQSDGLPDGFQTARTGSVQVDPRNHNVLYVAFEGAGVFKSTNGGTSWAAINSGLDDLNVFGIALDADSPEILYVSTNSSVYKTTSGGELSERK